MISTPNVIIPGTNENATHAQENDEFARDALETYLGVWRPLHTAIGGLSGGSAAQLRYFRIGGGMTLSGANSGGQPIFFIGIVSADLDLSSVGFSTKLRIQVATATLGGVATMTFGLYPFTTTGATLLTPTLGTVVSGSTVAVDLNTAGNEFVTTGSSFDLPANGVYCIGAVQSASIAASTFTAQLQYRRV